MSFQRIEAEKLSHSVVKQIEQLILRGILRPGERLPSERELSERLGVSRPSLRDAVAELQARGLVNGVGQKQMPRPFQGLERSQGGAHLEAETLDKSRNVEVVRHVFSAPHGQLQIAAEGAVGPANLRNFAERTIGIVDLVLDPGNNVHLFRQLLFDRLDRFFQVDNLDFGLFDPGLYLPNKRLEIFQTGSQ